ncbi:hypothetical protein M23134_05442 [Microscilla marina ATCC 23134]|uniref:Uncharacterized protein n=1 Tax=Microscilla marina ATCC 23134 TaxID=313606 RepID=A1ZHV3_MICM2|nr:hypothetical protein M23134_05442 [Microscilla marina ATCC 23134]
MVFLSQFRRLSSEVFFIKFNECLVKQLPKTSPYATFNLPDS